MVKYTFMHSYTHCKVYVYVYVHPELQICACLWAASYSWCVFWHSGNLNGVPKLLSFLISLWFWRVFQRPWLCKGQFCSLKIFFAILVSNPRPIYFRLRGRYGDRDRFLMKFLPFVARCHGLIFHSFPCLSHSHWPLIFLKKAKITSLFISLFPEIKSSVWLTFKDVQWVERHLDLMTWIRSPDPTRWQERTNS